MLEKLTLQNFKAFKNCQVTLRPLTLLSGLNSIGKSSLLQSLLLLRQSYQRDELQKEGKSGLVLNGELVQLGTGRDILFDNADEDEIQFTLTASDVGEVVWRFAYDRQTDVLRLLTSQPNLAIYQSSLFNTNFHYLQAERMGPRVSFEMSDFAVRQQRQIGTQGEYAAHFLHLYRDEKVIPGLHHPKSLGENLLGTQIYVEDYSDMDLMRLAFGFVRPDTAGNVRYYRPTNVGFGITYTLPVLLAILSAQPGALILLENPEAHLHPRGQSQIGNLLAKAANVGIQIIVETHSDHILNGIRVAVHEGTTKPDDVALRFFQRPAKDSELLGAEVVTPNLDKDGRIDRWPPNFFDEYSKSLRKLL
jgi:predicted ATPase